MKQNTEKTLRKTCYTERVSLGLMITFRQQNNSKHAASTTINGYRTKLCNCWNSIDQNYCLFTQKSGAIRLIWLAVFWWYSKVCSSPFLYLECNKLLNRFSLNILYKNMKTKSLFCHPWNLLETVERLFDGNRGN